MPYKDYEKSKNAWRKNSQRRRLKNKLYVLRERLGLKGVHFSKEDQFQILQIQQDVEILAYVAAIKTKRIKKKREQQNQWDRKNYVPRPRASLPDHERRRRRNRRKQMAKKRMNDPSAVSTETFLRHRKTRLVAKRRLAARRRGISFDLTAADLVWPEFCPILGIRLDYFTRGLIKPDLPTIDRVDPRFGYSPTNARIVSFRANTIKSSATIKEIQAVLDYVLRVKSEACDLKKLE